MIKCFLSLFFISILALATDVSMNDIKLLQYGDFTRDWKLVTVRYRQDSHEMRITYANTIAWNSMKTGSTNFPEGSVFAKVGFKSGVDPAFSSSIVPSGARRFQLMVKDSKKYPETDGWGYALFQSNGELFEGDVKSVTTACHTCHKLVPERNFIFSEIIETSPTIKAAQSTYTLEKNKSHILFSKIINKEYKNNLKKFKNIFIEKSLEIIQGDLRTYFFGGTLDEITPLLIANTLLTKHASAFVSSDQNTFKILRLSKVKKLCTESDIAFQVFEFRAEWSASKSLDTSIICYSKNNL
ncbi:MAG: cytochrome P460 family protein [Pseudobdellovibrio sp.]